MYLAQFYKISFSCFGSARNRWTWSGDGYMYIWRYIYTWDYGIIVNLEKKMDIIYGDIYIMEIIYGAIYIIIMDSIYGDIYILWIVYMEIYIYLGI